MYRATSQFVTERADGRERLVVIGELCADDDPAVLADLDTTDGRQPLQLFGKRTRMSENWAAGCRRRLRGASGRGHR